MLLYRCPRQYRMLLYRCPGHRRMLLYRCPRHRGNAHGENFMILRCPGHRRMLLYRCLGHRRMLLHRCLGHRQTFFQLSSRIEGLSQLLKGQSIKKLTTGVLYYKGTIKWEYKKFPQGAPLSCLPGVSDTGEQFKIRISARKFEKNRNPLRVPLMGP